MLGKSRSAENVKSPSKRWRNRLSLLRNNRRSLEQEPPDIVVSTTTEKWISRVKSDISSREIAEETPASRQDDRMVTREGGGPDAPMTLHRVGASIGHDSTINKLLEYIPDVFADEDAGIVAMFDEIHKSMPEPPTQVKEFLKATMVQFWSVWTRIQSSDVAHTVTDPEYGMGAMFREIGASLPQAKKDLDATGYMDAILAHMMHAYYGVTRQLKKVPELVAPNMSPKSAIMEADENDDISMVGMFREIARQLPDMSEQQVESYMMNRFREVSEEASERSRFLCASERSRFLCA